MLIYYINLDKRSDRRVTMEKRLGDAGLEAERVSAMSTDELGAEDIKRYCDTSRHFYLSPAELCCSLSHVRAMQRFLATADDFCLILEDDAVLSSSLAGFLADFERARPHVALLRLEADRHPKRLSVQADVAVGAVNGYRLYTGCPGAAGYIVSRHAASVLSESKDVRVRQIDELLFNPFLSMSRQLKVRQADPGLIIQEHHVAGTGSVSDSDIALARVRRNAFDNGASRWRLWYRLLDFIDRDIRVASIKLWNRMAGGIRKRDIPFADDIVT